MRGGWSSLAALMLVGGCGSKGSTLDAADGRVVDGGADVDGGLGSDTPVDMAGPCLAVQTLSPAESLGYAPLAVGDCWTYRERSRRLLVADYAELQQRLEVTQTKSVDGIDALVVADGDPTANPSATQAYLAVSDVGLVNHGGAGTDLPGTISSAAPYTEIPFPVQVCSTYQQFRTMTPYATLTSTSVMRSIGPTTVSGVTFPDALRAERNVISEQPVDGGAPIVSQVYSTVEWYAPGIGRVQRSVRTPDSESIYDITGALIGGVGHGVLPGGNLAMLDVDQTFLGGSDRPAVASDGQNFLVLSSNSTSSTVGGLAAMLVGPDGHLVKSTLVVQGGRVPTSPAVAYGAGRYLVAYPTYNSTIKAVMLSSDGTQLAPAFDIFGSGSVAVAYGGNAFLVANNQGTSLAITVVSTQGAVVGEVIPYPGQVQSSPALAFDGRNFLMAWLNTTTELPNGASTHVSAARVNAEGNAIDVNLTQVTSAPPLQENLDVAFDGTRYVVSWFHRTNQSLLGVGDVRIARMGIDGLLLDPGGRVVAPARTNSSKRDPRIARLGSQTLVVWERINYQASGPSTWIAGTRVDADGNSLDSSADADGLFISAQATGTGSQPIVPAIGWGSDRSLMVFVDRAGEAIQKRQIDDSLIYPW